MIAAHFSKGVVDFYRGNFEAGRTGMEQVMSYYTPETAHAHKSRFGHNLIVSNEAYLSWCLALQGKSEDARSTSERALKLAREMDDDVSYAYATVFAATRALFLDEIDEGERYARQALSFTDGTELTHWSAQARLCLARIDDLKGEESALQNLRNSLTAYRNAGMELARAYAQVWIAEAQLRRGLISEANATLSDLDSFVKRTGETYYAEHMQSVRSRITLGDAKMA